MKKVISSDLFAGMSSETHLANPIKKNDNRYKIYVSNLDKKTRVKTFIYQSIYDSKNFAILNNNKADILLIWGIPSKRIINNRKSKLWKLHEGRIVVVEKGYILRHKYYSIGMNGLNGRAEFFNKNSPSDRFDKLGVNLKPIQNNREGHILVCGQVINDSAVSHINYIAFTQYILNSICSKYPNYTIKYRPHPLLPKKGKEILEYWNVIKTALELYSNLELSNFYTDINQELKDCKCVVTFNSNAAVDATINGIPVICFDEGCMTYDISKHHTKDIDDPWIDNIEDLRQQWAYDIAYTQWNTKEISSGEWLKHLEPHMINKLKEKDL